MQTYATHIKLHQKTHKSMQKMFESKDDESMIALYIKDLQWKSTYALLGSFACVCISMYFFECMIWYITIPMKAAFGIQKECMYNDITEILTTALLESCYIMCLFMIPYVAYVTNVFMRPSLFTNEAQFLKTFSLFVMVLSVISCLIALQCTLPFFWVCFSIVTMQLHGITSYEPRLVAYTSFTLIVLIYHNMLFQLPWVAFLLHSKIKIPLTFFATHRKKMHVLLIIASAFICPPDVFSQCFCFCLLNLCVEAFLFFYALSQAYDVHSG
jgi:Sec-independent protein secretion pathway component TatC